MQVIDIELPTFINRLEESDQDHLNVVIDFSAKSLRKMLYSEYPEFGDKFSEVIEIPELERIILIRHPQDKASLIHKFHKPSGAVAGSQSMITPQISNTTVRYRIV